MQLSKLLHDSFCDIFGQFCRIFQYFHKGLTIFKIVKISPSTHGIFLRHFPSFLTHGRHKHSMYSWAFWPQSKTLHIFHRASTCWGPLMQSHAWLVIEWIGLITHELHCKELNIGKWSVAKSITVHYVHLLPPHKYRGY